MKTFEKFCQLKQINHNRFAPPSGERIQKSKKPKHVRVLSFMLVAAIPLPEAGRPDTEESRRYLNLQEKRIYLFSAVIFDESEFLRKCI